MTNLVKPNMVNKKKKKIYTNSPVSLHSQKDVNKNDLNSNKWEDKFHRLLVDYTYAKTWGGGILYDDQEDGLIDFIRSQISLTRKEVVESVIEFCYGTEDKPKPVGVTKDTAGRLRNYIWLDDLLDFLNTESKLKEKGRR